MASVACALDANQWMAWQRRRRVQWRAPSRRSQGARVCQIHTYIPISTSDSDGASSDTKEDGDNGTSVSDDNASDGDNVVVVFGDLPRPVAYNTLVMYDPKLFN